MDHWNFKWWQFFTLYGVLFIVNGVAATTESEIAVLGAYLVILAMLFVSAGLFYHQMLKHRGSFYRWNVRLWHVLVLYGAAFIAVNAVLAMLKKDIGILGAYLVIFTACLAINMVFLTPKKDATDES